MKKESFGDIVNRHCATFLFLVMSGMVLPVALATGHPAIMFFYLIITGIAHLEFSSYEREYKDELKKEVERSWGTAIPILSFAWVLIPIDMINMTISFVRRSRETRDGILEAIGW